MTLPNIDVNLLSLDEKIELRKNIQKQISTERKNKNLRITTFIPALKIHEFLNAKDWAFHKGFIPKNTNWAFTKFAVLNTMDLILTELKSEIEVQEEINKNNYNLNVPNQAIKSHDTKYPNSHSDKPIQPLE